jgi:folate-binding protein YgfZ
MATLDVNHVSEGYRALVEAVGIVDLTGRTQLELTGEDRAAFLHNFCTNSVRNLPVGSGAEAFILNAQGHLLGQVYAFATPSSLVVDTVPEQGERLANHLERYIIRENVEIADRTLAWGIVLVAGPRAAALLESLALHPPDAYLAHTQWSLMGRDVFPRRVDLVGADSWMLACHREDVEPLVAALTNAGAIRASCEDFDTARIEAGTPLYGRDISERNLPQEVNRDKQAISFTKGCYLGQETVARIDALGHVNRVLVGVRFGGVVAPPPSAELFAADEAGDEPAGKPIAIGAVTSAAYSPRLQATLALAYIRRGHTQPGTKLASAIGSAEVIALPL